MGHTVEQPTGQVVEIPLEENTAFYVCPAAEELNSEDLLPQTTGDLDAEPQRQVTRTLLHNDLDYVSPGTLQAQPFTVRAYLPDTNEKLQEIKTALKNSARMKFNAFFRDRSGVKGFVIPTRIKTVSDPAENQFYKDITFEPFLVQFIDAPTPGS